MNKIIIITISLIAFIIIFAGCVKEETTISTETPSITVSATSKKLELMTNSIDMEFVLIPEGEFKMGSLSDEKDKDVHEGPVHSVKIEKAYYLGKYEVKQKQWREVMGSNPSNFQGDDLPVENVRWTHIQEFIIKINAKEGTNKYRLPSEA